MDRSTRERWAIPGSLRLPLVERLGEIVRDPEAPHRDVLSAVSAILTASKINLANIALTIKVQTHEELEERVTEIERKIGLGKARIGWATLDRKRHAPRRNQSSMRAALRCVYFYSFYSWIPTSLWVSGLLWTPGFRRVCGCLDSSGLLDSDEFVGVWTPYDPLSITSHVFGEQRDWKTAALIVTPK